MENQEKKYTIQEIKNYLSSCDSLGDALSFINDKSIEKANIPKVCSNCVQRIGEECGIDGHEIFSDSTCEHFEND